MSWETSVSKKGSYERKDSAFRDWVKADGSTPYKPEKSRYHLYVSLACPWASRALVVRRLKGLEDVLPWTTVDWLLQKPQGWNFTDKKTRCELDPVHGFKLLREVYELTKKDYNGNITVPVLFDKKENRIVNNESADIVRILNSEFNEFCATDEQRKLDLYPEDLRKKIDEVNAFVYPSINNGVYRCGFAESQQAYEEAYHQLFDALDKVEDILSKNRYLAGNQLTEADVRIFTTLIRFDTVYNVHFKCNGKRIIDYPNIHAYLAELYNWPNELFSSEVNFEHIKHHYYESHSQINPQKKVPLGPIDMKLDAKYAEPRKHIK